jgi:DNA-binding NarL/FixJ family response regulator
MQRNILTLIAKEPGLQAWEIARRLNTTPGAIRVHISSMQRVLPSIKARLVNGYALRGNP